jgi:microcystin-dependent protein
MAEPFIGEVRMAGFGLAPRGWAFCNGQTLAISQNQALFSILGTTYGGDGVRTFGLPNLQSRVPIGTGPNTSLGAFGGEAAHTLLPNELASHVHPFAATTSAGQDQDPTGDVPATSAIYTAPPPTVAMASGAIGMTGGSQPHDNMQPYQVVNFIIALTGIYPTRS